MSNVDHTPQYKALEAVYKGEIAKAEANLSVYFKNSVGVGEHADIVEVMDEQIDKLAQAKDKLNALKDLDLWGKVDLETKLGNKRLETEPNLTLENNK